MPSWLAFQNYSTGVGYWLTKNFKPGGQSILYFQNPSSDPADGPYSGKYYVKNLRTGAIQPLFAGSNDNAAPGYGYLARDPVDGNTIAFTNSTSEYSVAPACVNVMHADGSNQRVLWCAPATIALPDYPTWPLLAVESIRWSGNGQKLMVYASYEPPPLGAVVKKPASHPLRSLFMRPKPLTLTKPASMSATATGPVEGNNFGWSALFVVDVLTGTAVEVAANLIDPPSGDISYDGTKVIYQQYDYAQCGDEDQEALGASLCFKDLTTGTVTDLFQPTIWNNFGDYQSWWNAYYYPDWYAEILLSPDGSQAVFTMQSTTSNEADLYTIRTDATNFRQLTSNPNPSTLYTGWTPVAWSPDGTRILANRGTVPVAGSTDQTWPSEVHIITVDSDKDRLVTINGFAIDWVKQ
ncbi:TolB family protein [Dyella humi]|uniref:Fucose-specific lectin n=1 Tax=Dyella humi TaxID=1770547 RepID=A0ABW8IR67_9GAMM